MMVSVDRFLWIDLLVFGMDSIDIGIIHLIGLHTHITGSSSCLQ